MALQVFGFISFKQGRWQESLDANEKALRNFHSLLGEDYFRAAQVCLKLAECHERGNRPEAARYGQCVLYFGLSFCC